MIELLKKLQNPEDRYTPIPFWFLNGDLCEEELKRQLEDFCAHGVKGVVLHPRMGLPERIGYLSSLFFRYIRFAVKEAARLGMAVVLYDEGMYPSGSASGQVVEGHPELASIGLARSPELREGDELLCRTEAGYLVARKSQGHIRGIHFGEDDGEEKAPLSADILNPEAVARFIHLTHDAYYENLEEYFGSTVIGFFTDEPDILGRGVKDMFPWSRGFRDVFVRAGGRLENLAALFTGEENGDTRLYERLIRQREGEVYYRALSQWCAEHRVSLMGHPHRSDDIEAEKYFQIPGQDLVLRWIGPETGDLRGPDSCMGKCGADAARLMGRSRNANECFGACCLDGNPWQLSGGDLKWYLDYLAVRGVNLFIPHAFYYSIEGKREGERPPDVGPHSIWWEHYDRWSLYMRRLSCLMTGTEPILDVAVPCRNRDLRPELVAPLFQRQIGFQYLPQSMWEDCRVEGKALSCHGRSFHSLLGEEGLFPEIPRLSPDEMKRDCRCLPEQKDLRCAHFFRDGRECWFLVNAGEAPIQARAIFPTGQELAGYDLWDGTAVRLEGTEEEGERALSLRLPVRGSILILACGRAEWEALPVQEAPVLLPCPSFTLFAEDPSRARKEYRAVISVSGELSGKPALALEIQAEEMAELYVNGKSAGVCFWAPQRFRIGPFLRDGENDLRLVVTGNMANLHGGRPVWYGLRQEGN